MSGFCGCMSMRNTAQVPTVSGEASWDSAVAACHQIPQYVVRDLEALHLNPWFLKGP